jgi:hypothetical protein
MTCILLLNACAERKWLGLMSSRVNSSEVHVSFHIIGEYSRWREKKFPGDFSEP